MYRLWIDIKVAVGLWAEGVNVFENRAVLYPLPTASSERFAF